MSDQHVMIPQGTLLALVSDVARCNGAWNENGKTLHYVAIATLT